MRAVVIVALAASAVLHAASYSFVISDDAFISMRYAANLANGHGLLYNPGEPAVEGFSNPLFTLVLAGLFWLGAPPLLAARGIGFASLAAIVLALPACTRLFQPSEPSTGPSEKAAANSATLLAPALFAASSFPAFWAMAGLETIFYALLVLLATALNSMELQQARVRWSPALFALVAASRPEGVSLAALALLAGLLAGAPRGTIRAWFLGFGLPVAALLAARLAYYDAFLPNTASVKVAFGIPAVLSGIAYLCHFTLDGGIWLLVPAAVACTVLVRRVRASASMRRAVVPLLAVVAAQVVFVLLVGEDGFPGYRFAMPVYPLLCILAAIGVGQGLRAIAQRPGLVLTGVSVLVMCAGILSFQRKALYEDPRRWWLIHDRPWMTYVLQRDLTGTWLAGHEEIAEYLRNHAQPDDRLAVTDAGVIPFVSELPTLDFVGLNDRTIASLRRGARYTAPLWNSALEEEGRPRWTLAATQRLFSLNPKWVVIDGHFDAGSRFVPRLRLATDLVHHRDWAQYREVLRAPVYDGKQLGLGRDRTNVLFVRRQPSESNDSSDPLN